MIRVYLCRNCSNHNYDTYTVCTMLITMMTLLLHKNFLRVQHISLIITADITLGSFSEKLPNKYKSITAAPVTRIYGVLCGLVYQHPTDDLLNIYGIITNAVLPANSPSVNDSNYWRLSLVYSTEFDIDNFGSKTVPTANFNAIFRSSINI